MPVRIKDIANRLNLSPATVSLVLNGKQGVGEQTRQRVLKLVEEMGYSTNALSKPALNFNKSIRFIIYKKHGLVVSDTPFFSALMEGIELESRKDGYNLVVSYVNERENLQESLRMIGDHPPDGILVLATEMEEGDIAPFLKLDIPMVMLDSNAPRVHCDMVQINNRQGAYEATRHLIDSGHTKIGYLRSGVWIRNFDERMDGFMKALEDAGLSLNREYLVQVESTMDGSCRDMAAALHAGVPMPTAFFADNDIIAFGAIKALKEQGRAIPGDISIIGFDDMPFCQMLEPPMSTVAVYKQRMGMLAVNRLIERMQGNAEEFIKIEVSTQLILRHSVIKR